MYEFIKTWVELKTDKRAVTALEYGLIAAALVVTVIVGFDAFATKLSTQFNNVATHLNG